MKNKVTDKSIYILAALIAVSWVTASILLAILDTGLFIKILIGLVPVSLLILQIIQALSYMRGQDEVQKRIVLEGLSIAFSIALPVIFMLGFMMKAGVNLPFDFIDSGYFMEVALLIGYSAAYRRYQ